jgi:hypothetical protein
VYIQVRDMDSDRRILSIIRCIVCLILVLGGKGNMSMLDVHKKIRPLLEILRCKNKECPTKEYVLPHSIYTKV